MRDFETYSRGVLRKVGYGKDRSSYPLISGDTYRALCDRKIVEPQEFFLDLKASRIPVANKLFYLSGFDAISLANLLGEKEMQFHPSGNLLIHNWDNIPNSEQMEALGKVFKNIYCVNWLGDKTICTPIPIGLENLDLWRNGVPRDFKKQMKRIPIDFEERSIEILCSFSQDTNFGIRSQAMQFFSSLKQVHIPSKFNSPKTYRENLLKTRFVISPPGNGADCHRTWEAIYSGAIPVVLSDYWPFKNLDLPVIVVDSWEETPFAIEKYSHQEFNPIKDLKKIFLE